MSILELERCGEALRARAHRSTSPHCRGLERHIDSNKHKRDGARAAPCSNARAKAYWVFAGMDLGLSFYELLGMLSVSLPGLFGLVALVLLIVHIVS